jgi:hypothetical protein
MEIIISESQYEFLINEAGTSEVIRSKYTREDLGKIASQYGSRSEFLRGNASAYYAAIRLGPCYDLTTNEEVRCKVSSKTSGALVYRPNTRNSFGFFESIASHMENRLGYSKKIVYSFTFYDDDKNVMGVYVGITNDEERRKNEHIYGKSSFNDREVKSAVSKFINENPNFSFEYKKLTELTDYQTAAKMEQKYVDEYRDKGYKILNLKKTGGGGRTFFPDSYFINKAQDWVKMKLEKGEVPYRGDYDNFDHSNYAMIRKKNLSDLAFKGMEYMDRKVNSEDDILKMAMSSDSYSEFYYKNQKIWQQARRRGLLPKIKSMFDEKNQSSDILTPTT